MCCAGYEFAGGSGGQGNWDVLSSTRSILRGPESQSIPSAEVPHGRDRSASEHWWQWDRRFTRYSSEGGGARTGRCGHSRGMAVERYSEGASILPRQMPTCTDQGFSGVRALRVRAGATYHLWDLATQFSRETPGHRCHAGNGVTWNGAACSGVYVLLASGASVGGALVGLPRDHLTQCHEVDRSGDGIRCFC